MKAVFYDLETSDRHPIGQILNYCFVAVDEALEAKEELSGEIRLSRLQLPAPQAMLANRIHILQHQERAKDSEAQGMGKIAAWLSERIERARGKLILAGYNSAKFDLPYLRTSLIRNGINPYFKGELVGRDLLFLSKKLSVSEPLFPRLAKNESASNSDQRLSLSLETLARHLGLLSGSQAHSSREDVYLLLSLARAYRERFDLDVLSYDPYEARAWHGSNSKPLLLWSLAPNYDLASPELVIRTPMALLNADYRYALWIDLERYRAGEGRNSIVWFNQGQGSFICGGEVKEADYVGLAAKAARDFSSVTVDNFFSPSTCDIEQDIYRLDMQQIEALSRAIWHNDGSLLSGLRSRDARVIYLRYLLANHKWSHGTLAQAVEHEMPEADKRMASMLEQYALYRYRGKAQLVKNLKDRGGEKTLRPESAAQNSPGRKEELFHPTFKEMLSELDSLSASAAGRDLELLDSLRSCYFASDIYQVAGSKLEECEAELASRSIA